MTEPNGIEQLANAVLYEGFLLYPYRPSAVKNQYLWNFGVVHPEPYAAARREKSVVQTECLFAAGRSGILSVKIRCLQLLGGCPVEREFATGDLPLADLSQNPRVFPWPHQDINARVKVGASALDESSGKLTVCVENLARYEGDERETALASSLVSLHVILVLHGGRFISLIDPPEEFRDAAAQCVNTGLWPVLADREDTQILASPIILSDHPQVAPQSPGDLFDATEIDEILSLRIRTMTDSEKSEASATDPRVRSLLNRTDALSREELFALHASMRGQSPDLFQVGDRVRLRPRRRADIFDMALAGKLATVVAVRQDFEDAVHVCVTVDDDPGQDLGAEGKPGHRFFLGIEELEPA